MRRTGCAFFFPEKRRNTRGGETVIAEVIVDIAHSETDKVFDYISEGAEIAIGSRVEFPFGRQTNEGFVIGLK